MLHLTIKTAVITERREREGDHIPERSAYRKGRIPEGHTPDTACRSGQHSVGDRMSETAYRRPHIRYHIAEIAYQKLHTGDRIL